MPKEIMTVLGPISREELGFTTMHEHIMMDGGWVLRERYRDRRLSKDDRYSENHPLTLSNIGLIKRNFATNWDALSLEDEEMMREEVLDYKNSGGRAILELSVPGIRHKVPAIKRIAGSSGVHVIVPTGLYTSDSWPDKHKRASDEELVQYMLNEIKCGIDDTGIKPGHLKIAVDTLTADEERALRAAARVANQTGFSLTVHCESPVDGDGRRVTQILKDEQMDVSRAVIAHAASNFGVRDMRLAVLHPEMIRLNVDYCLELLECDR